MLAVFFRGKIIYRRLKCEHIRDEGDSDESDDETNYSFLSTRRLRGFGFYLIKFFLHRVLLENMPFQITHISETNALSNTLAPLIMYLLKLAGFGIKVFLNHKSNLKGYSVFKLAKIKTCELADFFKSVHKCIAVYKKFS